MTTTPPDVVTKLGLQPRSFVVVKTFGVTGSSSSVAVGIGGLLVGYWVAVRPPSIPRTCPVTNDAASEQRKIAGPTRSPSSPIRRIGIRLTIPALNCGSERSE